MRVGAILKFHRFGPSQEPGSLLPQTSEISNLSCQREDFAHLIDYQLLEALMVHADILRVPLKIEKIEPLPAQIEESWHRQH
jgi:hypothetical protein